MPHCLRVIGAISWPILVLIIYLIAGCKLSSEDEDTDVVMVGETPALEHVATIPIHESDSLFIGEFLSGDVELDPLRLYLADFKLHRVAVINEKGQVYRVIGEYGQGPGELQQPMDVEIQNERLAVFNARGFVSVFDTTGRFEDHYHLPDGFQSEGLFSLTSRDGYFYMSTTDLSPRAVGLRAHPEQTVAVQLTSAFELEQAFGSYPTFYQEDEYVWRFRMLDAGPEGLVAVGYNLLPDVQIYDTSLPDAPMVGAISFKHPAFQLPEDPLPANLVGPDLYERAVNFSRSWHVYLFSDSTVVLTFENRTQAYYNNRFDETERTHYASIGRLDDERQVHVELPGMPFASDERGRIYVLSSHVPDQRVVDVYAVKGP